MNRDEKLTRPTGLPPTKRTVNGRVVVCPSEPGDGTWIALNDVGASLALINWYSVTKRVQGGVVSRGEIIKSVSSADSPDDTDSRLHGLPLEHINPFRLIGIFPATKDVFEWRWDLNRLVRKEHPWKAQQWSSSGFDERKAQRVRSRTFQRALDQSSAGAVNWLRRLHGSHAPQSGPFSICMHRADAATVSYAEVIVSARHAAMSYHPGPMCHSLDESQGLDLAPTCLQLTSG